MKTTLSSLLYGAILGILSVAFIAIIIHAPRAPKPTPDMNFWIESCKYGIIWSFTIFFALQVKKEATRSR